MEKRGPKNPLSDAHKAAMALGRTEGKIVRNYLEAVRASKGTPGRKRTADGVAKRLEMIEAELADCDALQQLRLIQERFDLQAELEKMAQKVDLATLEAQFIQVASSYGARTGVSYAAWRAVGVPPAALKAAGVPRSS